MNSNYFDYARHFSNHEYGGIKVSSKEIERQKEFAQKILIAQIKNTFPGDNVDFSKSMELIMSSAKMGQDAMALEMQEKQLEVSKGILLSSLGSFVGSSVESEEPFFLFKEGETQKILFEIPDSAINAQIIIEGQHGEKRVDSVSVLDSQYVWDGFLEDGLQATLGMYSANIQATLRNGSVINIKPRTSTFVTGIQIDEGGIPSLVSGDMKIHNIKGRYIKENEQFLNKAQLGMNLIQREV